MSMRKKEDAAAWAAWVEGVRRNDQGMALMRRIIDAVDRVRLREAAKDRDESNHANDSGQPS